MKYLKVYTGLSTGTLAGRDDGHPVTKMTLLNNLEELVKNYTGKEKDLRYYKLEEINITDDMIEEYKQSLKDDKKAEEILKNIQNDLTR
ncbi:MAG: hypothetical protein ACOCRX_08300 [Candidatus Woesearchaeota archaeon]